MNRPPTKEMMGMTAAAMLERKRRQQAAANGSVSDNRGSFMRAVFGIFPLLAIPVIIYNLMAFLFLGSPDPIVDEAGRTLSPMLSSLSGAIMTIPMIGGAVWKVTSGDALLLLSIALLFVEILKSTSTGTATIFNHAVSMVIFIICLVEFLLFPQFATSVFFIITMMTLLDVLAGVMVTIVSARRDFAVGEGFGG